MFAEKTVPITVKEDEIGLGRAALLVGLSRPTLAAAFDRGELGGRWSGRQRRTTLAAAADWSAKRKRADTSQSAGPKHRVDLTAGAGLVSWGADYAVGGYAAVHALYPRYLRSNEATLWLSPACFDRTVDRAKPAELTRTVEGLPSAILRWHRGRYTVITRWPQNAGRLVTTRANAASNRLLSKELLIASVAIEQAIDSAAGIEPDWETLALLLQDRGVDLAAVCRLLTRFGTESGSIAWPLSAEDGDVVERAWAVLSVDAKELVARTLRGLNSIERHGLTRLAGRGEWRPLGRSSWRALIATVAPAALDADRVLSLKASL